jgi:hypothetical protein
MARRKVKDDENITDASLERVIKHLENKGTKKGACQILNISYNVSRLDRLVQEYKDKKVRDAQLRAEKRGKPATPDEVSFAVREYLEGNLCLEGQHSFIVYLINTLFQEEIVPLITSVHS